ncbi:hypothetical protein ACHAWF_009315 [Thalassiosira exigua]
MTSLFVGASADDNSSPLLGKTWGRDSLNYEDPEAHSRPLPTGGASFNPHADAEVISRGGSSMKGYDNVKTCCPQILKSVLAVAIACAGAAFSVLCFLSVPVQPLNMSIWVYIMGGLCLFNSLIMIWNEKSFLFTLPTSRGEALEVLATRKRLEGEITALTREIDSLERTAARREEAKMKLEGIVKAQSSSVDEIVQLVRDNEEILDCIREKMREKVVEDVIRAIMSHHNGSRVFDHKSAKSLARKVQVAVEGHGIVFNEDKFIHALAMNATLLGAVCTVKKILAREASPAFIDKFGIFDMFHLPADDPRQKGSADAARATLAGALPSLAASKGRRRKQMSDDMYDDLDESFSCDSGVPKRHKNRLREQLYQFRMMSFPYFRETREGKCLFGTLILLTFVNSGINVYFSYLIRDFWTALAEKEAQIFYHVMYKFMISMIVLIPLQVIFRFIRVKLGIAWRKWLTERVLKLYFTNKVFYGLERQSKAARGSAREYKDRRKEIDNPDQRIQEDVASFTEWSLTFFLTIINTIIDLISFAIILFSILPELFIAIIIFAGLGTFFSVVIGKVLIRLYYESLQREADFRFSLVRIRENAESIAFYKGENVEANETKRKLTRVIDNMTLINWAQLRLDTFTTTYNHFVNILPIFILAHQYFTGLIEFGVISQAREAFWHILNDLSLIVNQFNGIASFMAGIDRLFLFMKAIQELDSDRPNDDSTVVTVLESTSHLVVGAPSDGISVKEYEYDPLRSFYADSPTTQPILQMRNIRLTTPDHRQELIQNLNLSLAKGQNLLISGVSGAGKSSLLRAIAGLWLNGDGEIKRPKDSYFLPQRP